MYAALGNKTVVCNNMILIRQIACLAIYLGDSTLYISPLKLNQ